MGRKGSIKVARFWVNWSVEGHETPHRAMGWREKESGMCVSHEGKHATQPSPHAHHCSDHRDNSQKVLHFVSLEDPRSHGTQGQVPITMQEEVIHGALPSHRLLRNSTRPQVHQPT